MPGTVSVACKVPNGLHCNVFRMDKFPEPSPADPGRMVSRAVRTGRITLQGPRRRTDDPRIIGGSFAVTENVDADLFSEWMKQNADTDVVKNRMVFAFAKLADGAAQAREMERQKSGLEPLDADDLPIEFRGKIAKAQRPE